jgi:hypothetical protein
MLHRHGQTFRTCRIALYVIDFHKRDSAYHRAIHISYPSAHRRSAPAARLERRMFRGYEPEIEEIWDMVPDGRRIEIRP